MKIKNAKCTYAATIYPPASLCSKIYVKHCENFNSTVQRVHLYLVPTILLAISSINILPHCVSVSLQICLLNFVQNQSFHILLKML